MQQRLLLVVLCVIGISTGIPLVIFWLRQREHSRVEKLREKAGHYVGTWKVTRTVLVNEELGGNVWLKGTELPPIPMSATFLQHCDRGTTLSISLRKPMKRPKRIKDFLDVGVLLVSVGKCNP
jgi:hypothetical protein